MDDLIAEECARRRGKHMIVAVTGSRTWNNKALIERAIIEETTLRSEIDGAHINNPEFERIVVGDCHGADYLAKQVARELGLKCEVFIADWNLGKVAGPIRNGRILDQHPDVLLVFHNDLVHSKGTANMVLQALQRDSDIKIRVIRE